jgi:AraC-like DNA-binding protein
MMNAGGFSIQTVVVDSIDCLRQPISDADIDIVQLGRGQLKGTLTKAVFADLAFSRTDFTLPLRTCGLLGSENLTICMLLSSATRSTSWAHELGEGDIFFSAPGKNFDAVFGERSNVAGISITPQQIASMFASEPILSDVGFWTQNHQYACPPEERAALVARVMQIATWLDQGPALSSTGTDFWRRCLVEAFTSTFAHSLPPDVGATVPSALKLVREVERYLDTNSQRAVHVSEICLTFGVSRRTLHRAFHDVLGVGPITFLRHHRLCSVHQKLRQGVPGQVHVTDVATEFGFLELGRFAHYYLSLFGEYPSQTLYRNTRSTSEVIERSTRDRSA